MINRTNRTQYATMHARHDENTVTGSLRNPHLSRSSRFNPVDFCRGVIRGFKGIQWDLMGFNGIIMGFNGI